LCVRSVAEAVFFHLFCGGGEALGTCVLHGEEAEGLGERDAVGAGLKEFDMSTDFAEDGIQSDFTHGSVGNRAFGEDGGTSGKREALKDANEADIVDGKQGTLAVGDANARGARMLARLLRLPHNHKHRKRPERGQDYGGVQVDRNVRDRIQSFILASLICAS